MGANASKLCLDLGSESRLFNVGIWGDFTVHTISITSASDSQAQTTKYSPRLVVKKGKTIVSEKEFGKNIFFKMYVYII